MDPVSLRRQEHLVYATGSIVVLVDQMAARTGLHQQNALLGGPGAADLVLQLWAQVVEREKLSVQSGCSSLGLWETR